DVRNRDEDIHQTSVRVSDRKITLMILQRRDGYFGRERQVLGVKPTGERHGPLDEGGDLIQQIVSITASPPCARPSSVTPVRIRSRRISTSATTHPFSSSA